MKKNLSFILLFFIFQQYGQIGVNTIKPLGSFHVDAAADNPTNDDVPSSSQQLNDFIVTNDSGISKVGIGTITPSKSLDINGDLRIRTINIGTLADIKDNILATDADGNVFKINSTNVFQQSGGVSKTAPIIGNGTTSLPLALDLESQTMGLNSINQLISKPVYSFMMNTQPITFTHTSGQELSDTVTPFTPSLYNFNGQIQVKVVLLLTSNASTTHIKLRSWNNTSGESFIISNASANWTFTTLSTDYYTVESIWQDVNTSISTPRQFSLHTWLVNNTCTIQKAYLLVRTK